jgi:FkbH-like protein
MRLIVRNTTLEHIYTDSKDVFTDYGSINELDENCSDVIWNYFLDPSKSDEEFLAEIDGFYHIINRLKAILIESQKLYLVSLSDLFNVALVESRNDRLYEISKFNLWLLELSRLNANIFFINSIDFFAIHNRIESIDFKYFLTSQIVISPKLAADYRSWIGAEINKFKKLNRKKCLVLDLDNTLWHGVLGEDGVFGVQMDGDYPGNVFSWFQKQIIKLQKTGVLLCICSKNNEEDIQQLWDLNSNFELRKDLFASIRINWEDKSKNIFEIAQELNIGLDSIVFIDDSPTERALVKTMLPEVVVPEFPNSPHQIIPFIKNVFESYFKLGILTDEDIIKTKQYQENRLRIEFESTFADKVSFLRSLGIKMEIGKVDDFNVNRVAQLTQKTNQFNLTTKRYTTDEIIEVAKKGGEIFTLSVSDRFGNNGLTGLCILKIGNKNSVEIDTLLLSCRILGKHVEHAFISFILNELKSRKAELIVTASYLKSAKNKQVFDFYDHHGFKLIRETEDYKNYELILENWNAETMDYIEII